MAAQTGSNLESKLGRVLILYPGPNYDIVEDFREYLLAMSASSYGDLLTTSTRSKGARIGRFGITATARAGGKILAVIRYVSKVIEVAFTGERPRIVACYDPLRSGIIGCLLKKLTGARLVVEVNGDYTEEANFMEVKVAVLRRFKMRIYKKVAEFVLARADGVKVLYDGQLSAYDLRPENQLVRCFHAPTNLDRFSCLGDDLTVVSVGAPWHVKGMDVLVEAFKKIAIDFPHWRLKIVGWFPNVSEVEASVGDHPQIDILPPIRREEMPSIIGNAGIIVQASRTETMGRVLLEAAAAKKARIASAVGGIPAYVSHDQDGILVEPENVAALGKALSTLMSSRAIRERLGNAANINVRKKYSECSHYRQLVELYADCISRAVG